MLNFKKFLGCLVLHGLLLAISFTTDCKGVNPYGLVKECPAPVFSNGKTRSRQRGRLVKYQCRWGYELVGQRYTSCVGGSWDSPPPFCIRPGCPRIYAPENGVHMFTRKNAVVMFFCNPGYAMIGSGFAYCNGLRWNGTTPKCELNASKIPAKSCDFESADLCGWTHDPYHDFDWRRQNCKTPSGHVGTGPSYDHTLGYGKDGYYMYIESSSRRENDTARLISPVYPASLSQSGCFIFCYHMYGRTIGSLRVLVVPVTVELGAIVNDTALRAKYTMFQESGNQGNAWYRGFFDLDVMKDNFQIVIEGVRGSGYVSDIAIDDVSILEAEQCAQKRTEHTPPSTTPATTKDSCLNRCDQTINTTASGEAVDCACVEDCVFLGTCCVDYRDICVFSVTDSAGDTPEPTTQESSTEDASSVPPPLPPSLKMTATNIPDDDDERKESRSTFIPEKITIIYVPTKKPSVAVTSNPTTIKQTTAKPPTTARPATVRQATTTAKPATQKPTVAAKILYTTTKPTPTTAKLVKTTKFINVHVIKTVVKTTRAPYQRPTLQFATPSPPIINATGILNRPLNVQPQKNNFSTVTRSPIAPRQNVEPVKNYTANLDMYVPRVVNATKAPASAVMTEMIDDGKTDGYSKTFDHYSVDPPGHAPESSSSPRNAVIKENVSVLANDAFLRFIQDTHDKDIADAPSTSWGLVVAMTFLAVGCCAGAIFLVRSGRLRTLLDKGRMRMRLGASSSNSDMRFLVQDEELEHDYED